MTVSVFPNFEKSNAFSTAIIVCEKLHKLGVEIIVDKNYSKAFKSLDFIEFSDMESAIKDSDIVIAIGGDGTILKYAGYVSKYDKSLLGINMGRLGFMASLEADEFNLLENLVNGNYVIENRMMLNAEYNSFAGIKENYQILNDFVIARSYSRISDFEVYVDERLVSELRADGIVFSTPTGSTAYALSAGGPILDPFLECIEFTPICPHSLSSRPMLFAPSHKIRVIHKCTDSSIYFSVDGKHGHTINKDDYIEITKSESYLKLIDISGFSFYDAVNNKLMRPIM